MVASEVGEETLLICGECQYRANSEKAEFSYSEIKKSSLEELKTVDTPDIKTIDDLVKFFNCDEDSFLKSIVYDADGKPVMAVVPGSREINEAKLSNYLKAVELDLASDSMVEEFTGAPVGFAGPVTDKKIRIIFDPMIKNISNAVVGANLNNQHLTGVNPGRDFKITEEIDISTAREGDLCPKCGAAMHEKKGIEVGHIFKLGYKYTEAMKLKVLDEKGKEVTPIMGCYGIGVNRTMAAVVEQNNDERGIIWPKSVAPFDVHLIGIAKKEEEIAAADEIYNMLIDAGVDVLYDDRKASPGFKFADADLIGIPLRITIGKSYFEKGMAEVKKRNEKDISLVNRESLVDEIKKFYS